MNLKILKNLSVTKYYVLVDILLYSLITVYHKGPLEVFHILPQLTKPKQEQLDEDNTL